MKYFVRPEVKDGVVEQWSARELNYNDIPWGITAWGATKEEAIASLKRSKDDRKLEQKLQEVITE